MSDKEMNQTTPNEQLFKIVLEEACRQWCSFMEECPERGTGEGFADFFFEVYKDKHEEYAEQIKDISQEQDDDMGR